MAAGPPGDDPATADEPATVRAVVARTHDRGGPALVAPERATDYSAREFATGVRKAANLFSHYGVAAHRPVAVVVGPKDPPADAEPGWLGTAADPLLAMLGGMTLGVPVDLVTSAGTVESPTSVAAPLLVAPVAWLDRFAVSPGTAVVAYGGPPADPPVSHFERERWSENPTEPPEPLAPEREALRVGGEGYSHATLLDAARAVVTDFNITGATQVGVASRADSAGWFVAAVLAPLLAGVPIRPVPDAAARDGEEAVFVVAGGERRAIVLDAVL